MWAILSRVNIVWRAQHESDDLVRQFSDSMTATPDPLQSQNVTLCNNWMETTADADWDWNSSYNRRQIWILYPLLGCSLLDTSVIFDPVLTHHKHDFSYPKWAFRWSGETANWPFQGRLRNFLFRPPELNFWKILWLHGTSKAYRPVADVENTSGFSKTIVKNISLDVCFMNQKSKFPSFSDNIMMINKWSKTNGEIHLRWNPKESGIPNPCTSSGIIVDVSESSRRLLAALFLNRPAGRLNRPAIGQWPIQSAKLADWKSAPESYDFWVSVIEKSNSCRHMFSPRDPRLNFPTDCSCTIATLG